MTERLFGKAIKRREDPKLIRGQSQYMDDIQMPGMLHVALLRSPHGHAAIKHIDTQAAAAMPGVVRVITAADFEGHVNPLPCAWPAGGVENRIPAHHPLVKDKVRFVGDPVAAVVAETRYQAYDALEAIQVEYEPLPAVIDQELALRPGAPQLHDDIPNNTAFYWTCGDRTTAEQAIASAEVVIKQRIRNQRLIPNPMETRGAIARYDEATDEYTVWLTSQAPHVHRLLLGAFVMGIPEHKLRIIAPALGGGFGSKIFLYEDMPIVIYLSKALRRPIKWVEPRSENMQSTAHGRDHIQDVTIAGRRDGKITGLFCTAYANLGAYASTIGPGIPTTLFGRIISGVYDIEAPFCEVYGVYTNTTPVDAYRGAGRPEASFLIERMVDIFADEIGMDPGEVRRRNYIGADSFPFDNRLGYTYDSGNYEPTLEKALAMVGYESLATQKAAARQRGKRLGVGLSSYIEVCGVGPSAVMGREGWGGGLWESAVVRLAPTGKVTVITGSLPHGQGHETSFAQLVADELGVDYNDIEVKHSDTQGAPFGYGSYGSRSLAVGGSAIQMSVQKIKEKARRVAAHLLEAAEEDVVYDQGKLYVQGAPDNAKTLADISLALWTAWNLPAGIEPSLEATTFYDPQNFVFPFGTHIAVVEVDEETGQVDLVRYIAVDDVGNVLNPLIVNGQFHGGIAQGVGQALFEAAVYDESGQLLSGTFMDYAMPKASRLPSFELEGTVTPTPVNPLGVKGAGEAGTIASAQAVVNAVCDALSDLGVRHIDMPLTAEKVWRAMQGTAIPTASHGGL